MARRCPRGHVVTRSAIFCPDCWELVAPARPPMRKRVFWPLVSGSLFAAVYVAWAVVRAITTAGQPTGPVANAQRVLPAVMTIEVLDSTDASLSQGSGFLMDSTGRAVTAYHVLQGAHRAVARLPDGRLYDVLHVDAWDSLADLAVFSVGRSGPGGIRRPRAPRYPALRRMPRARAGEPVVVVGSPEGFANSLSDGLVSAIRSTEEGDRIQLTAPISPGSSGGPVFDAKGRVLGVVVERFEEGQNLNFASPVTKLVPLLGRHDALALPEFGARTRDPESGTSTLADELFEIGNRHYESDRYQEALERYLLALRSDSTHSAAAYNAALCEVELGNTETAALLFKQYLRQSHEEDQYHRQAMRWLADHARGRR